MDYYHCHFYPHCDRVNDFWMVCFQGEYDQLPESSEELKDLFKKT